MSEPVLASRQPAMLLVEDNPSHAMLITRSLRDQGLSCEVHHVSDGEEALDYLFHRGAYGGKARPPCPCLILLDLRMPKVDGLTVLEEIKADPHLRSIPVVVLTSSDAESDIAMAYERRANSYLVKPGDYRKLLELSRSLHQYWLTLNRCPATAARGATCASPARASDARH